jgi:hypothetical protein
MSHSNAVIIVTGYRPDDQGVRVLSPSRDKNCHFFILSRMVLGPTKPPIQLVQGALSPEIKQPGCEADHLPQTSAVK